MTDSARWKATVYVGGLAPLVTDTHVFDAFIPFGDIVEVQLPKSDASSQDPHKGFAYVEYEDSADAKEAIDNMDQSEFFGRVIKVSPARAPKSADEGLGSKKAIWEQVSCFPQGFVLSRELDIIMMGEINILTFFSYRRAGLLSMRRRMTSQMSQSLKNRHQIPCKVSRGWMLRGPSRSRD
jgi:RNA recognition motif-containing protein